ncbi:hypothetical protein D3C86_870170 [compost metagenome]
MLTAFRMHRMWLAMSVVHLNHRNFLALAVVKLSVAEVIPFAQRRQILITQHSLGTGRKH